MDIFVFMSQKYTEWKKTGKSKIKFTELKKTGNKIRMT